jgi:hypothetical protein
MKNKKIIYILSIILLLFGFKLIGQDTVEWIGSYSSKDLEGSVKFESKTYFYWQIESLKRAVSPRFIKLIDIENYVKNRKFINKGILFTYFGLRNEEVSVCGNFSNWRCIPMKKNKFGVFHVLVPTEFYDRKEQQMRKFEYKFQVDNIFEFDPENQNKISDGSGSYYSEYIYNENDFEKQVQTRIIQDELSEDLDFMTVEFRIYKPTASVVALVGDFNQWNPEHDYLQKNEHGIFTLRKKLRPGEYLYNLIVDGEKILDTYNSETRHRVDSDELSSYIKIIDYRTSSL